MTAENFTDVTRLMERYFEGLYHADSKILRTVFHPELAYVSATEGDELYLGLEAYMLRIDKREAPSKRNETRRDVILEVAFANDRMARVTSRMTMMGRDYLDYLTLVRHDLEWRVVAKAFTYISEDV